MVTTGRVSRALSATLFALALTIPATAESRDSKAPVGSNVNSFAAVHIDNFGKVDDAYYRGSQPGRADYGDLAKLGVKTVIDLQADGSSREKGLVAGRTARLAGRQALQVQVPSASRAPGSGVGAPPGDRRRPGEHRVIHTS